VNNWDRIVREHGPAVFSTAWRILGHAAETEDVVEEVFSQARRVAQAEEVRSWERLLRRLAATRALDRLRRRPPGGRERDPAERLRSALARLPDREAAVFSLRYFDDLSCDQISQTLLLTRTAVTAALRHARARLEGLLRQSVQGAGAPGAA
jgi:RNA polymerase sigma-70 factor (ECF subfamily)